LLISSGCNSRTTTTTDDDNIYLYKILTKEDGILKPRTIFEHDSHINHYFSNKDDIDPSTKVVITKIRSVSSLPFIKKEHEWLHGFTINLYKSNLDISDWRTINRVKVGCLVYRNKIVGMVFFGPQWKDNTLEIYIAADEEGLAYLKNILMRN